MGLAAALLLCAAVAGLMGFLLYGALADGLAYGGRRSSSRGPYVSTEMPVAFWFTVAVQYVFGVLALSAGFVMAIKLVRSLGKPRATDDPG